MDTPMKKEKMGIESLIDAKKGLDQLLQQVGIPRRTAYWLDKNRKKLETPVKKWEKVLHATIDKYKNQTPAGTYVPLESFAAFKKEMLVPMEVDSQEEAYNRTMEIFAKHELTVPAMDGIAPDKINAYQEEIRKEAETFEVEIEYMPIEAGSELDEAMKKISGEASAAIGYMLTEPSKLAIVR